jgi:hypothetical protein
MTGKKDQHKRTASQSAGFTIGAERQVKKEKRVDSPAPTACPTAARRRKQEEVQRSVCQSMVDHLKETDFWKKEPKSSMTKGRLPTFGDARRGADWRMNAAHLLGKGRIEQHIKNLFEVF